MSIREFFKQLNNRPKVKGIKCLEETVERFKFAVCRSRRNIIVFYPIPDLNVYRLVD